MAKLVAYYSRAGENYFGGAYRTVEMGNTKRVALMIAEATGANLFEIEQHEPYSSDYRTCTDQAMADKRAGARPPGANRKPSITGGGRAQALRSSERSRRETRYSTFP